MSKIIEVLPIAKTFKAMQYTGENIDDISEFIDLPMAEETDRPKVWKVHRQKSNHSFFLNPGDFVYIAPNGFVGVWTPAALKRNWLAVVEITHPNFNTNVS